MTATIENKYYDIKPVNDFTIYDWQGDEHALACPKHPMFKGKKGDDDVCLNVKQVDGEKIIDACCPDDLVVCAGERPIILQAEAHPDVRKDTPRIEQGDRRCGDYYVKMLRLEVGTGLLRVKQLGRERLAELEKKRQIRTGDRPADWVLEARKKAKDGHDPAQSENVHDAMTRLSIAARNW